MFFCVAEAPKLNLNPVAKLKGSNCIGDGQHTKTAKGVADTGAWTNYE